MCIRDRRSHWRAEQAVAQSLPWGLLYLLRLYCVLATEYSLRHTKRLMSTTVSDMMRIAAASSANLAPNAAPLMTDPIPCALRVSPRNVTISATMLAFQAPPVAVTQPVTR